MYLSTLFFELGFIMVVVEILENIFETTVIFFHDGVFTGEIEWVVSVQSVMEALVGEFTDRRIDVIPS